MAHAARALIGMTQKHYVKHSLDYLANVVHACHASKEAKVTRQYEKKNLL